MAKPARERSACLDAVYVAVGLGVLGFQKLQVRRRELTTEVKKLVQAFGGQFPAL